MMGNMTAFYLVEVVESWTVEFYLDKIQCLNMNEVSRRKIVLSSSIFVNLFGIGCLSFRGDSKDSVRICDIRIHNRGTESHDLHIQISRDGHVLRDMNKMVPPSDDGGVSSIHIHQSELPDGAGDFAVRIRIDDGNWSEWDLTTGSGDVGSFLFVITQGGSSLSWHVSSGDNLESCKNSAENSR